MNLTSVVLGVSALFVGLTIASDPDQGLNTTTQSLGPSIKDPAVLNTRYPDSYFIRTPNHPQMLCGDTKNLTVVANNIDHNVTTRNCEALRDMYALNSTADGNGYWNFTFHASDRNDTDDLSQFTVDFDGDCKLKIGLVDYSEVPLDVQIGNIDIYDITNTAISGGNFSSATGQVGCDGNVQVVWAVEWIPGGIGR